MAYLSLVAAAAAGLAASVNQTGAQPVQIELEAPEGCSGADAFWSSLRSRTDRVRRADRNEPRTTLKVRLTRGHGQVVGELRIMDDRGGTDSRKVQGASCDEVVQALSLTAALALDPSALFTRPAGAPGGASTAAASAGAAPAGASTATASAGAAPAGASTATASAGAAPADLPVAGATPTQSTPAAPKLDSAERAPEPVAEAATVASPRAGRPVPGVEIALGPVGLPVLSGSFSAGAALAVRKILGTDGVFRPSLGLAIAYVRDDLLHALPAARSSLAALGATVCPLRWSASILTLQPCALVLGGWLSATGRGVTHAASVDRLWLSAGGTVRMAAFLGAGLSLELEAGVSAPLRKRRFFVTVPTNVVAETPTISPIVGIALTWGF